MSFMALYFLDYDLRKQRDYQKLYDELARLGAVRHLKSAWSMRYPISSASVQIRDHLKAFIDKDDGLMVAEVVDWAGYSLDGKPHS